MNSRSSITVVINEDKIRFPNAFRRNLTGPTGGYWTDNQINNFVFRPFFSDEITKYDLKIFNRWGVLIYESYDVYKGWDGYSEGGHLALQGVYVWEVDGQFSDGTYFENVGDVTFLH